MKRDYILVLPSWYPSKLDKFNGDFNERLVHAVSDYRNQIVVYVSTVKGNKLKETEIFEDKNIITYKAYFPNSKYDFINVIKMLKLYLSIFKLIFKTYGLPKLVHNYVFFPSGIISVYLKYRYNLRIVLTEHWTIFNADSSNIIKSHSLYKKNIYKLVLHSFDTIISVSESLNISISKWTKNAKSYVLPNVVDVNYFNNEHSDKSTQPFTFIHVSNMGAHNGFHKNVIGILNVFNKIIKDGVQVNLILVGQQNEEISDFLKRNILLDKKVQALGELPYQKVSHVMKASNAFILFSRYENMPCVILEALCCGLPVISTDVGGISTIINKANGLLIESENEKQLENAIILMVNNYHQYDINAISEKAISLYNYDHIGKQTDEVYLETLG